MRIRRRSDRRASLTRRAGFVVLVGLLTAVLPLLHPEPVSAASGVDDYPSRLKNAAQDSLVDPWDFYNRECTSWVAWRLNSENQVAFTDYWQGVRWGNASNWKKAALSVGVPVDNNPTRGSVAWWAAGSAGSSVGHVAWVEAVGDGAITIEEYNYLHRGYYDTRTISSSSSLWPSGFIHIKDTQIRNTAAPTVTGTPQVGQKLTTSKGTWSATHLTFSYQWLADGSPIPGATSRSFTPSAAQLGQQIQAKVTASKSGAHSGTAKSAVTPSVAKGVFVTSSAPAVQGTAQVGVPLTASTGTWSPTGTMTYQWLAGGQTVTGATGPTFTPTAAQLGRGVKVRITMSAPGYQTKRAKSASTSLVAPGQFVAQTPPTVSGVAQVDQPLTADPGTWTPSGTISYQWLADGKPIAGATGTTYTPTAADLRANIAIQVTVSQVGYTDAVATSVATLGVAPGTFVNTAAPSISGTPQVGVALTATKGSWTPKASVSFQWLVDGAQVPGATGQTFTPRPQDVGKKVTVEARASRAGYLDSVVPSKATATVAPGVIVNHGAPVVSGRPMVGHTLRTTDGSWSITPDAFRYQWYSGHAKIRGATSSTYQPTTQDAGHRIHVVVTATSAGYTPLSSISQTTTRVVLGRVAFDKPVIRGHVLVGRTLTARTANLDPGTATATYDWYRGATPIVGAHQATYVVQAGDLGHPIHVVVTMRAQHWIGRQRRSVATGPVKTVPHLGVRTSMRSGRVLLHLVVASPGIAAPQGHARAWLGARPLGTVDVVDGQGSRLLARMRRGTHTVTLVYHGGPNETIARRTVTVTVP